MKTPYTLIVERMLEIKREIESVNMVRFLHDEPHLVLQITELQKEYTLLKTKRMNMK